MRHCQVCDCNVAHANWTQHINGTRHQSNKCCTDSDSSSCGSDDSCLKMVRPSEILYKQDSIAPEFSDGTSLEEGIANVRPLLHERDPHAFRYIVNVKETHNGGYVAMNTRTLHCYEEAGFDKVPVNVVGTFYGRRRYRSIFVRGRSFNDFFNCW